MRASVHIDGAESLGSTYVEDEHALDVGELNHLKPVGCLDLPRTRVGLAACVGRVSVVLGSPVIEQRLRPGLEGDVLDSAIGRKLVRRLVVNDQFPPRTNPVSLFTRSRREVHSAVRPAGSGLGNYRLAVSIRRRAEKRVVILTGRSTGQERQQSKCSRRS